MQDFGVFKGHIAPGILTLDPGFAVKERHAIKSHCEIRHDKAPRVEISVWVVEELRQEVPDWQQKQEPHKRFVGVATEARTLAAQARAKRLMFC